MALNLRRREYVDPVVQGALMRRLVLHWTSFIALAGSLAVGLQWVQDPFATTTETLARAWWTHGISLMLLVSLMPIFIYDSVKLSNRFTGPISRLRVALRTIAEGDTPPRVVFRDNDFWNELATDFNKLAERLEDAERAAADRDQPEADGTPATPQSLTAVQTVV